MCQSCEYAANQEAARRKKRKIKPLEKRQDFDEDKFAEFATGLSHPPSILFRINLLLQNVEMFLGQFFKIDRCHVLKAVVKKVVFLPEVQKKDALAVFFLRGDDELEETKAHNALCASGAQGVLELVDLDVKEYAELQLVGDIAPHLLSKLNKECWAFFDESLSGENTQNGQDLQDPAYFYSDSNGELIDFCRPVNATFADIVAIREGDICPCCGGTLTHKKGIEVGHIFKLGDRYSRAMGARFLDSNGKETPFIMGCYGIGVSRLLPAILEQKSDEFGCVWSKSCAPFGVSIILSNMRDCQQMSFASELYEKLKCEGVEVLFDDRDERFGFKMKDFELIGVHLAIIIGKSLEEGRVEIVLREGMQKHEIPADLAEICAFVRERL